MILPPYETDLRQKEIELAWPQGEVLSTTNIMVATMSIAVSLKRIADAMDKANAKLDDMCVLLGNIDTNLGEK